MNRRFDVMETLSLNRRTRNGGASRKSGPKSNGKSPAPKREKLRLARLEQLEERALLAVLGAEGAEALEATREVATSAPTALETPALDLASCSAATNASLAQTPSVVGFGTGTTTVDAETFSAA